MPHRRGALRAERATFLGIVGVALALLQFGCATPARLRELPVPPQRVALQGYSFLPPAERGWVEAVRNPSRIVLGKFGAHTDETFAIQALAARAPEKVGTSELAQFVRGEQEKDIEPNRHRVLEHEVAAATRDGVDCVQSSITAEDNAARKRSARPGIMVIEAISLACRHPKDSSVLITLTYSHRFYPEHRDARLREKAAALFATLQAADF